MWLLEDQKIMVNRNVKFLESMVYKDVEFQKGKEIQAESSTSNKSEKV